VDQETPEPDSPTIMSRIAYVPQSRLDAMLAQGAGFRIPLVGEDETLGLDGETWTFEWEHLFNHSKLQWWCDGPTMWGPFIEWVQNLAALLDELVEGAGE
jgi:hypothetical protein